MHDGPESPPVRIVLDTNILVSSLIGSKGPSRRLFEAWASSELTLVTSRFQIDELTRVVSYDRLQRFINPDEATLLIQRLEVVAEVVGDLPIVDDSPDPDDNFILATAVAGRADMIVSGDKAHMVQLGSIRGIPIRTAADAVDQLFS